MKKVVIGVALVTVMAVGFIAGMCIQGSNRYTVDRVEKGADGESWVVVEVYNPITDTYRMLNVKAEDGYRVVDNY